MKITCYQCGIEFEKAGKEIRRQEKEGRNYLKKLKLEAMIILPSRAKIMAFLLL